MLQFFGILIKIGNKSPFEADERVFLMKKVISLILVAVMAVMLFAGCSKSPDLSYVITGTVDGENKKFETGPYRYYIQWMTDYYYAYVGSIASQLKQEMDWKKMLADTSLTAPKTLSDYIITNAKDQYMTWLYIESTFEELGLELTAEDEKAVNRIIQSDWVALYGNDRFNTIRQTLGLSYDEFWNLMACNVKSEKILDYYYGEGGPNEITEEEMKDYYTNNYVRFKYAVFMLEDTDGNDYDEQKVAQIKANKDAALAALDAGTSFEDVLVQYSDDYNEITDKMTVSEKESYELQNKTMVEDGLIINDEGVFSQTLATYYNITIDEEIVDEVFGLKDGEYTTVTTDNSIWIVKRYSNTEKDTYYTDVKESVFSALYADDLSAKHTEWRNRLNYVYNDAVIEAYKPENLADLFDFSNTSKG